MKRMMQIFLIAVSPLICAPDPGDLFVPTGTAGKYDVVLRDPTCPQLQEAINPYIEDPTAPWKIYVTGKFNAATTGVVQQTDISAHKFGTCSTDGKSCNVTADCPATETCDDLGFRVCFAVIPSTNIGSDNFPNGDGSTNIGDTQNNLTIYWDHVYAELEDTGQTLPMIFGYLGHGYVKGRASATTDGFATGSRVGNMVMSGDLTVVSNSQTGNKTWPKGRVPRFPFDSGANTFHVTSHLGFFDTDMREADWSGLRYSFVGEDPKSSTVGWLHEAGWLIRYPRMTIRNATIGAWLMSNQIGSNTHSQYDNSSYNVVMGSLNGGYINLATTCESGFCTGASTGHAGGFTAYGISLNEGQVSDLVMTNVFGAQLYGLRSERGENERPTSTAALGDRVSIGAGYCDPNSVDPYRNDLAGNSVEDWFCTSDEQCNNGATGAGTGKCIIDDYGATPGSDYYTGNIMLQWEGIVRQTHARFAGLALGPAATPRDVVSTDYGGPDIVFTGQISVSDADRTVPADWDDTTGGGFDTSSLGSGSCPATTNQYCWVGDNPAHDCSTDAGAVDHTDDDTWTLCRYSGSWSAVTFSCGNDDIDCTPYYEHPNANVRVDMGQSNMDALATPVIAEVLPLTMVKSPEQSKVRVISNGWCIGPWRTDNKNECIFDNGHCPDSPENCHVEFQAFSDDADALSTSTGVERMNMVIVGEVRTEKCDESTSLDSCQPITFSGSKKTSIDCRGGHFANRLKTAPTITGTATFMQGNRNVGGSSSEFADVSAKDLIQGHDGRWYVIYDQTDANNLVLLTDYLGPNKAAESGNYTISLGKEILQTDASGGLVMNQGECEFFCLDACASATCASGSRSGLPCVVDGDCPTSTCNEETQRTVPARMIDLEGNDNMLESCLFRTVNQLKDDFAVMIGDDDNTVSIHSTYACRGTQANDHDYMISGFDLTDPNDNGIGAMYYSRGSANQFYTVGRVDGWNTFLVSAGGQQNVVFDGQLENVWRALRAPRGWVGVIELPYQEQHQSSSSVTDISTMGWIEIGDPGAGSNSLIFRAPHMDWPASPDWGSFININGESEVWLDVKMDSDLDLASIISCGTAGTINVSGTVYCEGSTECETLDTDCTYVNFSVNGRSYFTSPTSALAPIVLIDSEGRQIEFGPWTAVEFLQMKVNDTDTWTFSLSNAGSGKFAILADGSISSTNSIIATGSAPVIAGGLLQFGHTLASSAGCIDEVDAAHEYAYYDKDCDGTPDANEPLFGGCIDVGADPPSTCEPGECYIDTDDTDDTNCTTTGNPSICFCTSVNTWQEEPD